MLKFINVGSIQRIAGSAASMVAAQYVAKGIERGIQVVAERFANTDETESGIEEEIEEAEEAEIEPDF